MAALALIGALSLAACLDLAGTPARRVVVVSPDGKWKAAIYDMNGGATVETINWVELAPSQVKFKPETDTVAIFSHDEIRGLAWEKGRLVVYYGEGTPQGLISLKDGVPIEYRPGRPGAPVVSGDGAPGLRALLPWKDSNLRAPEQP